MSGEPMNSDSNPCLEEQRISLKCLQNNYGDHKKCEPQIENYKDCKTFWYNIYKERKRNNTKPYLPSKEERMKMKQEYINQL
ncbi:coiled-coil-helix-coiled-coil-helix domain-containing protein 7 isoform X2 [Daktulosphaira vitifoliae]|uniref:coiled-coil-helix-coiled-coil-helix domain-containing protein 7 isoform X2 n=1 Tax=Daktulosphaira vitifoliae TaxID=58002 RepID=UPI0021AAA6E8|nr:coiled-coil-helix-coiled-coil-helix domain-containing protein 7 isoform X2 [Daktulosphaira vitifoliae]